MTSAAIELTAVSKRYRHFALSNLTLRLERGEIMGLVGANGAGKSTTLRMIMGMVLPDSGTISVLGHPVPEEQVLAKARTGFVSQEMGLFASATVEWHLGFVRSIDPYWDEGHAAALLRRFHLQPAQRIRELSAGERVKLSLLLALARRPQLLVLDEPTAGLDPVARHEVLGELMQVLESEERALLFSSHNTLDVEQISDRITFIDRGQIISSQDREQYLDRWRRVIIDLPPSEDVPPIPGLCSVERDGSTAVVVTDAFTADTALQCSSAGATIRDAQRMTLEEIFVATVMRRRKEQE